METEVFDPSLLFCLIFETEYDFLPNFSFWAFVPFRYVITGTVPEAPQSSARERRCGGATARLTTTL